MSSIIKNYMEKECFITTTSATLRGIIKEVADGWLAFDNGKSIDAINLDYIIQIKEISKHN